MKKYFLIDYIKYITFVIIIFLDTNAFGVQTDLSTNDNLSNNVKEIKIINGKQKQTFLGFGASQPTDQNRLFMQYGTARVMALAKVVYGDLGMNWARLWVHSNEKYSVMEMKQKFYQSYADNSYIKILRSSGAKNLLLAPARGELPPGESMQEYARKIAKFIFEINSERGIKINTTGIANEPAGFSAEQLHDAVKFLRIELDALGMHDVGIIGPECASPDACASRSIIAIKSDAISWNGLRGVATHSYNMGANALVENLIGGTGKEYWISEAGRMLPRLVDEEPGEVDEASTTAARFLNDMNHSVTHWFWFIGVGHFDKHPAKDSGQVLARPDDITGGIKLNTKYHYLKQLRSAFDLGAVFYEANSNREKRMNWGYGQKPAITASTAQNPDGSWAIGVVNTTGISTTKIAQYFPASSYRVSIKLPAGASNAVFRSYRSKPDGFLETEIVKVEKTGVVNLLVVPNELVTLRSK